MQLIPGEFCLVALRREINDCQLIDEIGNAWKCKLRWALPPRSPKEYYVTVGWRQFAWDKGLNDGSRICFGAVKDDYSNIYLNL